MSSHKVLIMTGGLVNAKDRSLLRVLQKQLMQSKVARSAWLEVKIKAVAAEPILAMQLERKSRSPFVQEFFSNTETDDAPELTEVVLAGLLNKEGIGYELATYNDIFRYPKRLEKQLQQCDVVFASSTLLHDLSEMLPLIGRLKRPHNRIVAGGALAGELSRWWNGASEVDILAVGYGEMLVPALARWIRSDFTTLEAPPQGRLVQNGPTQFLYSGVPETMSLDFLPRPDWKLSQRDRRKKYKLIHYESVRGCPYRCAFCNYPYLFDDARFRMRSAECMAEDWAFYVNELGVEYISCLDSLFTMPKRRLVKFCQLLLERNIRVKWLCYARADDLVDEEVVKLMHEAGAVQVQIGVESGSQQMLDNMNKRCTVEANHKAIENCRKYGITTLVSVIAGYPGETEKTLEETCRFLHSSRPDFFFIATFSTRVAGVPVLNPQNKARFGLWTMDNAYTMAPYWQHATMSCADVGNHVREMSRRLVAERISLDATLFYQGILHYRPEQREALLDFQYRAITRHPILRFMFDRLHGFIDKRLLADLQKVYPQPEIRNLASDRKVVEALAN